MDPDVRIETIEAHSAGQPVRVVAGGLEAVEFAPGPVRAQRDTFAEQYDWIRQLINTEPRGHANLVSVFPVEPASAHADLGAFFTDNSGYLEMCGDGTISLVTAFVETGRLPPLETVLLETPIGVVEVDVTYAADSTVDTVTIRDVPTYYHSTTTVTLPLDSNATEVPVDLAHAGHFYALVDVGEADFDVTLDGRETDLDTIVSYGSKIRSALGAVEEKRTGERDPVAVTMFYEEPDGGVDRNVIVYGDDAVGRAPCGTGTCAKMALLYENDELELDASYRHASVLGTEYEGRLSASDEEGSVTVLSASVGGRGFVTGESTFYRDDDDVVGFRL